MRRKEGKRVYVFGVVLAVVNNGSVEA